MNRRSIVALPAVLLVVTTLVAACGGSSGPLGTLPPASDGPDPSVAQGSPDVTPQPSDLVVSDPSEGPSAAAPSSGTVTPTATPTQSSASAPSAAPSGTTIVRAYLWLGGVNGSDGLVAVLREVPATKAVARAAVTAVLAGPSRSEADRSITSELPGGAQLLGISIENAVATVDLSSEFEAGGDSTGVRTRFGQLAYTVTQFSNVRSVSFRIEGEPATVFDPAGAAIGRPVTRADFVDLLPAIWVDRPAFNAAIGNPARITGTADVFEATFRIALIDGNGRSLADRMVMATCGTGCRGTFDVTLDYSVGKAQYGTLRAYNLSAKDGSPESVREYRVWLTPRI